MIDKKRESDYNTIVHALSIRILNLSNKSKKIILKDFDYKNENHLLLLRCALLTKNLTDLEGVYIDTSLFNIWRIKKLFGKATAVQKLSKKDKKTMCPLCAIHTQKVLDSFLPNIKEYLKDENFQFSDIYNEFYK